MNDYNMAPDFKMLWIEIQMLDNNHVSAKFCFHNAFHICKACEDFPYLVPC